MLKFEVAVLSVPEESRGAFNTDEWTAMTKSAKKNYLLKQTGVAADLESLRRLLLAIEKHEDVQGCIGL